MDENQTLSASEIHAEIQLGIAQLVQRAIVNDLVQLRLRLQAAEAELAAAKSPPESN